MNTTTAPLVIRLRDIAPISDDIRATIALDTIRAAAVQAALDEDRTQATDELYAAGTGAAITIAEYTPTVVVSQATLLAHRPARATYVPRRGLGGGLRRLATGRTASYIRTV